MVFCTFCGYSGDEKCLTKTRIYPQSNQEDHRGPICKLCDRKFLVHKEVEKVYDLIHVSKITLVSSLTKLEKNGIDAKFLLKEEDSSNTYMQKELEEIDLEI